MDTVGDLKKRNRSSINKIKHRAPFDPSEITFYCTTLRPLIQRTEDVSNWISFMIGAKQIGIQNQEGWW